METIKEKILEEYKKGNIVVATHEGLQGAKLSEFVKQPAEGILYDLNRDEATVLTFIDDPKWVNDYAVSQTIRALKNRIDELEGAGKENYICISGKNYSDCHIHADSERGCLDCGNFQKPED